VTLDFEKHASNASSSRLQHILGYLFRKPAEQRSFIDFVLVNFYKFLLIAVIRVMTFTWRRVMTPAMGAHTGRQTANHYNKISIEYEKRHSRITNGRDLWWRRQTAFAAAAHLRLVSDTSYKPVLVDLCTGTGLGLEEMFKVFALEGLSVAAYGIDFSAEMLRIAKERTLLRMTDLLQEGEREVEFVMGDAMNLVASKDSSAQLFAFPEKSVDVITIVCGIGGIGTRLLLSSSN
jgi:SAM-dependent methyltransferase